jgi:hypothetical protein
MSCGGKRKSKMAYILEGFRQGLALLFPPNREILQIVILSLAVGLFLQGVLDPKGADWQKVGQESMQIIMNGLAK